MGLSARIAGAVAGAAGIAASGAAVRVAQRRRAIARRSGDAAPFGTLRSPAHTVIADDGVPLHVEVDEADSALTVVFVHGYALNLDCWHFQRAAFRGLVRTVFYDQRSHGRSGRGSVTEATVDQLGRDLKGVIDAVVPDGPVVLVGHSMGGMTIVALAELHPELFGGPDGRIAGVALISTTAGGLDPARLLLPLVPRRLSAGITDSTMRTLARSHRAVDGVRRLGRSIAAVVTDAYAFGDAVPQSYVEFVDDMLSATPFQVVAEFFPGFRELDKFDHVGVLDRIPTTIIGGTGDKLTSIGHSRKLHSRIPSSTLVECEGAGHMVIMERHGQVNACLDQLLAAASSAAGTR